MLRSLVDWFALALLREVASQFHLTLATLPRPAPTIAGPPIPVNANSSAERKAPGTD